MLRSNAPGFSATVAALFLFGHAPPALAFEVSFDEAVGGALHAPAVVTLENARAQRSKDDGKIGGTLQGLSITLMPGVSAGPGVDAGPEFQVNGTQGINLGGRGGASREAARDERSALGAELRLALMAKHKEAADAWLTLHALEGMQEKAKEREERLLLWVTKSERARALGVGTTREVEEAKAALAQSREHYLELEAQRFAAQSRLRKFLPEASVAKRPPTVHDSGKGEELVTRGEYPEFPLPETAGLQRVYEKIELLPQVSVARLHAQAARARVKEQEAATAPLLSVGAQVERTAQEVWVGYGVIGMSWQSAGQSARQGNEARQNLVHAEGSIAAARQEARAMVEAVLHELVHSGERLRLLKDELLPATLAVEEGRRAAHSRGEETLFAVLDAEEKRRRTEEALVLAEGQHVLAKAEAWLILRELDAKGNGK